jgi:hypothetical protein
MYEFFSHISRSVRIALVVVLPPEIIARSQEVTSWVIEGQAYKVASAEKARGTHEMPHLPSVKRRGRFGSTRVCLAFSTEATYRNLGKKLEGRIKCRVCSVLLRLPSFKSRHTRHFLRPSGFFS